MLTDRSQINITQTLESDEVENEFAIFRIFNVWLRCVSGCQVWVWQMSKWLNAVD